ncbi:energy-coupling factor transport system ATP-binding protein [Tumebacillus sp. BK434]|uniref:ABC transporter ATP-binding protein n=1 Tax=Tumebacillus sp. BK434 TaxID=2512169 RepID=UPI00104F7D45|nr:ABC transporter ATP-binding protein [Tumebacillus sp. BK434]TCP53837.1 energy-coupling factor transport system ATP-binding protein [Tumebacillus sp. BK434]
MASAEIQLTNLTYCYPDADRPALNRLTWGVQRGEFVVLAGPSGCGKSTLLRALNGLVPEFYGGKIAGAAAFRGKNLSEFPERGIARHIGMTFQDPEKQLVMTEVEREIAFGLENLRVPQAEMRRRVAEVMSFFDLTALRRQKTDDLSGGEKQKVAIASVMALQPDVLLLDEPTSQLDPGTAQEILDLIKRLNEELGITVILVEQRLDRVLHLADRVTAMYGGEIEYDGDPAGFARHAADVRPELLAPVTRLFVEAGSPHRPLTVKEGRQLVTSAFALQEPAPPVAPRGSKRLLNWFSPRSKSETPALVAKNVRFAYPEGEDVLKGLDLEIGKRRLTAILGANGTGKSTLFRQFAALIKPTAGRIEINGRDSRQFDPADLAGEVGYLSQNPSDYLFHDTLWQECQFSRQLIGLSTTGEEAEQEIGAVLRSLGLFGHKDRNPRDLSGGERQRAALAAVLVQHPQLLLLDEPTRGLDAGQKDSLGAWLSSFLEQGGTVVLITHDVEFAAEYADQIVLIDDGTVAAAGPPQEMLTRGMFYAPQVGRVFRGVAENIVTLQDGVKFLTQGEERQ